MRNITIKKHNFSDSDDAGLTDNSDMDVLAGHVDSSTLFLESSVQSEILKI